MDLGDGVTSGCAKDILPAVMFGLALWVLVMRLGEVGDVSTGGFPRRWHHDSTAGVLQILGLVGGFPRAPVASTL